jgi:hypothetical protein
MVDVTGMQVSEFGFWVESAFKTRGRNKGQPIFCGGCRCEGCISMVDVGSIDVIPSISLFPAVLSKMSCKMCTFFCSKGK